MELGARFDARGSEALARGHLAGLDVRGTVRAQGRRRVRFIEGPPTMNGVPHAGHLRGRVIKDYWYRFATLRGAEVEFCGGWDTQGLPVELQAEKELGVTGGKAEAVRRFGMERMVSECREIVKKYNRAWVAADEGLGVSLDHSRAYWTFSDGYIEREWQVLKRALAAGILEEDHTVIAYCPGCQTSLSHAEVNQGYEEVRDPSLYYKVRLEGGDEHLVVWTTMPFTLVTDALVGVNPDEEYVRIIAGDETWIVGRTRLGALMGELGVDGWREEGTVAGRELEGRRYVHPLLGHVPGLARRAGAGGYHTVVAEPFVDASTGSGLVHLSPANGEEDIRIARRRGVEVFCPIDDEVRFTADAGRYSGMFVRDADRRIVDDLREAGALVKIGMIRHSYPLCWRSRHPIVWLARRGWFYKLDRLGDAAVRAAGSVEYYFDQPRNRFLGIVGERHPWCISRERVWGCPLPVWTCKCGHRTWLFSRREIVDAAESLPDGPDFELHRPWIDSVVVRCQKCGGTDTSREEYVLDTWHNSGAAPYASLTDAEYGECIPAPFMTEGIDQTRGWAYTLLVENVILGGGAPYSSFLFQGHVLDADGGKMSKSRGNVLDAAGLLEGHPADLLRYYLLSKASPIEPLSFDAREVAARPYQVLSTLFNAHLYYMQNSGYDGYDRASDVPWARGAGLLGAPDAWLLSRLQGLVGTVTEKNGSCRFHEAARALDAFIIDDLSQTYIPMTRGELWDDGEQGRDRRCAIYAVLAHVLRTLDVLAHPFCPFATEHMYQSAFGDRESVLLEDWPERDEAQADPGLEESFEVLAGVVSAAAAARMDGRLKRRWPLDSALVCVRRGEAAGLERLHDLLRAQLNVERVEVFEAAEESGLARLLELRRLGLPARAAVSLDRKSAGPKAKRHMPALVAAFEGADPEEVVASLQETSGWTFETGGESIRLDSDDIIVGLGAADGHAAAGRGGRTVFVSTTRSREMTARGLVRDVARRLQALRKERGYSPTDVLGTASVLGLDAESQAMVGERSGELAFLVRVRRVTFGRECSEYRDEEIDGQRISIAVE